MTFLLALIARLLGVPPDVAQIIAIWVAIAVALGSAWGGYAYIKHRGAEEVRTQIEKDNQDAIRKGIEASRSFDDCVAAHGLWDFRRQRCAGPSSSAR